MALHTELQIYATGYQLLGEAVELVRNMPKDYKPVLGTPILADCRQVMDLIREANIARDHAKVPHLELIGQRIAAAELLIRIGVDKGKITRPTYARVIALTQSIGRQCTAWRNKFTPVA